MYTRAIAGVFTIVLLAGGTWADCGSIPFRAPIQVASTGAFGIEGAGVVILSAERLLAPSNVKFDPLEVVVFEPGQRAIVLWNGQEETLLLSTEIRTSTPVSILEVIPFPSEPTVRLGDFDTFKKMQRLLIDKTMWRVAAGGGVADAQFQAGEVTFRERMGAHDVGVVRVNDQAGFVDWVRSYLADRGATQAMIEPEFARIIQNYVDRGIDWFVFDRIDTSDQLQSHQPLEYRFKTDKVFYPLEISTRERGDTTVDLLVLTPSKITETPDFDFAVKREKDVRVSPDELARVDENWGAFMGENPFIMQRFRLRGDIRSMTQDFVAK